MKLTSILAIAILALSAGFAQAGHKDKKGDYGRVIHVEPIYRSYTVSRNDHSCIQYDRSIPVQTSYTGTILGALILSVLNSMLTFMNVGQAIQQMVYGSIVLLLAWGYAGLTRRV